MIIRTMAVAELARLGDIDRSEAISQIYHVQHGALVAEAVQIQAPPWSPEKVAGFQCELADKVGAEGGLWGAFDGEPLAGIAALEGDMIGPMADEAVLAFLHVSAAYRRQGLGHRLLACVCRRARERGARLLYISAIPSNSAVGFYTGCGARPAERVDPERFALEPEDIHLALAL